MSLKPIVRSVAVGFCSDQTAGREPVLEPAHASWSGRVVLGQNERLHQMGTSTGWPLTIRTLTPKRDTFWNIASSWRRLWAGCSTRESESTIGTGCAMTTAPKILNSGLWTTRTLRVSEHRTITAKGAPAQSRAARW